MKKVMQKPALNVLEALQKQLQIHVQSQQSCLAFRRNIWHTAGL